MPLLDPTHKPALRYDDNARKCKATQAALAKPAEFAPPSGGWCCFTMILHFGERGLRGGKVKDRSPQSVLCPHLTDYIAFFLHKGV